MAKINHDMTCEQQPHKSNIDEPVCRESGGPEYRITPR